MQHSTWGGVGVRVGQATDTATCGIVQGASSRTRKVLSHVYVILLLKIQYYGHCILLIDPLLKSNWTIVRPAVTAAALCNFLHVNRCCLLFVCFYDDVMLMILLLFFII